MKQYKEMLRHILSNGKVKEDRTGVGTISVFGYQTRYDLSEGFPLVTIKRTPFRIIAEELLWFISGSDSVRPLLERNVHIWDEWAFKNWYESEQYKEEGRPVFSGLGAKVLEEEKEAYTHEMNHYIQEILIDDDFNDRYGSLRRVYGKQWREWETKDNRVIDQLNDVIERIKNNPNDRRLIVSAWNVGEIGDMALPPCHSFFQFYVQDGKLSCQLYQRSSDTFLGAPFNIASYSLLIHLVAHVCGLDVGDFVHTLGDMHLYTNQLEQTRDILERECLKLPKLKIVGDITKIDDFTIDNIILEGYESHSAVRVEVAV